MHPSIVGIVFNGKWLLRRVGRRRLPAERPAQHHLHGGCASPYLTEQKTIDLFEKFDVLTEAELYSRQEIKYEAYAKALNIEARAMIDIASKQILPVAVQYAANLAHSVNEVRSACAAADTSVQEEMLCAVSDLLRETRDALKKLTQVTEEASGIAEGKDRALYFRKEVNPAMEALRSPVDKLEMIVDKDTVAHAVLRRYAV